MTQTGEKLGLQDWRQLRRRGLPLVALIGGGLVARTASECHTVLGYIGVQSPWAPTVWFASIVWLWWVLIIGALWSLQAKGIPVFHISLASLTLHVLAAPVLAVTHMAALQAFVERTAPIWPAWGHSYLTRGCITGERFSHDLITYAVALALCLTVFQQLASRQSLLERLRLEREVSEAQLQALQSQLEPHFLFIALNAIQSLIDLNRKEDASSALMHLNAILRSSLRRTTPEKVPLSEEVQVVKSYLAIQQIRFADRLQVRFATSQDAMESLVPNFLLQPLIENAIQHGIAPMLDGGLIETFAARQGDMLCVRIVDNGHRNTAAENKGHGIGLSNIRKRLEYLYPNRFQLEARSGVTGGFEVMVLIPFEGAEA
jgi:hypothetical protein